jgi:hypothetical protein
MRQSCKIATSDEGMEKLMDHTLRRQIARMEARQEEYRAQMAELLQFLKEHGPASSALTQRAEGAGAAIVNGSVALTQNITKIENIEKVEIHAWDPQRPISISVANILAAFTENPRLREYSQMPDHALIDPETAPPYVTDLMTDLVTRGHADPASRNIYLNPKRADQVLVHMKGGTWEVRTSQDGYRALLDGVAMSIHEVTMSNEKRQQLPLEAQNALAMAGLMYASEPEEYVGRAKGSLAAHLANMAPGKGSTVQPGKSQ